MPHLSAAHEGQTTSELDSQDSRRRSRRRLRVGGAARPGADARELVSAFADALADILRAERAANSD